MEIEAGNPLGSWPDGTPIEAAPLAGTARRRPYRPSTYSEEIANEICDRLGDDEDLHAICADEGMPSAATVFRWKRKYPDFDEAFDCALEARFEKQSRELVVIAKDGSKDKVLVTGDDGIATLHEDKESLGRSRLVIETMERNMAKGLPRKFGEPVAGAVAALAPALAEAPAPQKRMSLAEAMVLYGGKSREALPG